MFFKVEKKPSTKFNPEEENEIDKVSILSGFVIDVDPQRKLRKGKHSKMNSYFHEIISTLFPTHLI